MAGNLTQVPSTSSCAIFPNNAFTGTQESSTDSRICLFSALSLTEECQEVSRSGDPSEFSRVLKRTSENTRSKKNKNTANITNSSASDSFTNWCLQEVAKESPTAQMRQECCEEGAFPPSRSTPPDATDVPSSNLAPIVDAPPFRRQESGESSYSSDSVETAPGPSGIRYNFSFDTVETETDPSGSGRSLGSFPTEGSGLSLGSGGESGEFRMQRWKPDDLRFGATAYQGSPTTLMIRNIPLTLTQEALALKWPNDGTYDFFYVPCSTNMQCGMPRNKSYAFINFTSHQAALDFKNRWDKVRLPKSMARKTISITCADVQGQAENLLQLIKKRRWRLKVKERPLIYDRNGTQITLEEADRKSVV